MKKTTCNNVLKCLSILLLFFALAGNSQNKDSLAKFEPEDGKILVFIGQDLEAVGGLESYIHGYCNYFDVPAGVTLYTNISPGDESFGYYNRGNDGLKTVANWGAGDSCGAYYLNDEKFNNALISIGLSIVNHEKQIAKGKHDKLIIELGEWIKSTNRPVFLRIGYEFDGWDWNHYKKKHYLKSWQRIHTIFKDLQVTNVAFVWQSKGTGSGQDVLEDWYPGDDIVDWVGYSYFGNPDTQMLTFARKHNKPVFIAEATPAREMDGLYFNSQLTNPEIAKSLWGEWFIPFFKTINDNSDIIKAFSYINANWASQPMWINNPTFQKVDSRLQMSDYVAKKWVEELEKPQYIKSSVNLFNDLRYQD
ncbi:glycoside hydrolase family 26 protein [uncultured Winogradskyella sp.]|uniref:glycoside hydrolase family 26 protein n=1 Tax=uncultured Winogradskyella sp. TaxID=395353 RepID=UPI0026036A24|nr:glycosyl hydrolase [uncultured Winogradskyella sp.]